jgi:hypothetical protein
VEWDIFLYRQGLSLCGGVASGDERRDFLGLAIALAVILRAVARGCLLRLSRQPDGQSRLELPGALAAINMKLLRYVVRYLEAP